MDRRNRIKRFLREQPKKSECIIVSSIEKKEVILSYKGSKISWKWRNGGLICPGASDEVKISPYAAEALVSEELNALLRIEGIDDSNVSFVDQSGKKTDGIMFIPDEIDIKDINDILKTQVCKGLLKAYINNDDIITEEMIHVAIENKVLEPFLSMINAF